MEALAYRQNVLARETKFNLRKKKARAHQRKQRAWRCRRSILRPYRDIVRENTTTDEQVCSRSYVEDSRKEPFGTPKEKLQSRILIRAFPSSVCGWLEGATEYIG